MASILSTEWIVTYPPRPTVPQPSWPNSDQQQHDGSTHLLQQQAYVVQQQPTPPYTWFGPYISHRQHSKPRTLLVLFNTTTINGPRNIDWYMDIGATAHLHADASILKTFSDRISCSYVFVGDGSQIAVSKMADTDLSFTNPYRPLSLKIVLITPNITKNLIYVRLFTNDNWCSIEFDPFGFSVKDLRPKQILIRCDNMGDLYHVTPPKSQAFITVNLALWHQRLGHPSRHVFHHLVSNKLLPF